MNTPNQAAWFERFLTDWSGPKGRLGRMKFRMKGSVFPGDTMVLGANRRGRRDRRHRLRLGDGARAPHRRRRPEDRLHGAHRAAGDRRRQSLDAPRRRRGDRTRSRDGSRPHRRAGDAARDGARRVQLVRATRNACASSKTTRSAIPAELWKQMAALDLIGLMIPTEYGGSEMTSLEGAVVYMELGRALAPSPHFVSAVMSAGVLLRGGSRRAEAAGCRARVGRRDLSRPRGWNRATASAPRGVQARATADGDDSCSRAKWHVPFASAATKLLVLARTGDGDDDVDLFLVDPAAAGVELTQQFTIASDTQYEVTFDGVRAERDRRRRAGPRGTTRLLDGDHAARGPGRRRRAATRSTSPCSTRRTASSSTSRSARSRQSRTTSPTRRRRSTVRRRWCTKRRGRVRTNGDVDRLAPMAKLFACQTFRDVTAMAQQVFGGVGFTVEYDIQLYFRRAKQLQISWWDDRTLEEMIATAVL